MNIVRALNQSGDWEFGQGNGSYLSGIPQVAQNIQTRLNTLLGECFFNTAAGVDWFTYFGTPGSNNQLQMNLAISAIITNTPDVLNIVSYTTNVDTSTRTIVLTYNINTVYGPMTTGTAVIYLLTQLGQQIETQQGVPLIL